MWQSTEKRREKNDIFFCDRKNCSEIFLCENIKCRNLLFYTKELNIPEVLSQNEKSKNLLKK